MEKVKIHLYILEEDFDRLRSGKNVTGFLKYNKPNEATIHVEVPIQECRALSHSRFRIEVE